jgi:hypothetical protein
MKGKETCNYLKVVRREVAAANGLEFDFPECTYEGECQGTCPQCESEVRQLEQALSLRKSLSQKVSILGVAAGLAFSGMTAASAQTIAPADTAHSVDSTFEEVIEGELPELSFYPEAEFVGGKDSLNKYIMDNFNPNFGELVLRDINVLVTFYVDSTGMISEVKVWGEVHSRVEKEIIRMISAMPPWKPAVNEMGKPVESLYVLPINIDFQE